MYINSYILFVLSDLSKEVTTIVVAIVIGIFTVVGGVGGAIYVAYFSCLIVMCVVMVYMTYVFWDPLDDADNLLGNMSLIYNKLDCVLADVNNQDASVYTFISEDGMKEGILLILGGSFINHNHDNIMYSVKLQKKKIPPKYLRIAIVSYYHDYIIFYSLFDKIYTLPP